MIALSIDSRGYWYYARWQNFYSFISSFIVSKSDVFDYYFISKFDVELDFELMNE